MPTGNKAGPSWVDPGTPTSDRRVESPEFQTRPNCAPVEILVPEGVLELIGPFPRELGVPVPQPENSSIPRHITPAMWAARGPSERNIKVTVLRISVETWGYHERTNMKRLPEG